ncbi:DUF7455 domain-containing protein [Leucobacter sp. GX24907]
MTTLEQDRAGAGIDATEVDAVESAPTGRPLTGLDRCDSCGAQAYVLALLSGSELLFCAHHARKVEPKLRPMAELWHDESHKLNA